MTTELYKRHRPKTLDRVLGNTQTVQAIRNMLTRGTLPHTILFHGPSGCGKTTLARILKEELKCNDMDFKELNCSDFRGIDTVREIMRTMNLSPTGACRVYLLDEVHQMSKDGQNAALKMLEDTPAHVYFFLCTTDPGKIIKTLRNRCCELPVQALRDEEMERLIGRVCKREEFTIANEVREEILKSAQGSARLALVLLDKVKNLTPEEQIEGVKQRAAEENEAIELCRALLKKDSWKKVSVLVKNLKGDPESARYSILGYARACLLQPNPDRQALVVIECFASNFYDSKEAGLAFACYNAIHG